MEIILTVIVESHIDSRGVEMRGLDTIDPGLLRQSRKTRGEICPLSAVVGREPNVAIVGSDQRMPGRMGDSATAVIVPCVSAPELSRVIPPVSFVLMMIRAESLVERSGEIGKK
jgi:hypothetical protein